MALVSPLSPRSRRPRRAFTILELIVVFGISAVLAGMAITYSNIARNRTTLAIETAKIAQFILQAKQLSVATYGTPSICAYGAKFNMAASPQNYSIFAYTPPAAIMAANHNHCPDASAIVGTNLNDMTAQVVQYSQGTWQVPIAQTVKIDGTQPDTVYAVLFYPPDPKIFFVQSDGTISTPTASENVHLVTNDGQSTTAVTVNPGGQVTF